MSSQSLPTEPSSTKPSVPGLEETGSPPTQTPRGRWMPRSCFSCNNRKVRCDKKQPCSSCLRNGKQCAYPPSGPRIRRRKKTIMADMASRLSSLEQSFVKGKGDDEVGPPAIRTPVSESTDTTISVGVDRRSLSDKPSKEPRDDIVVQNGSSSEYINEVLFSRVIEGERNIESVLSTPQATPHSSLSPFSALGIISHPSSTQRPSDFHPSKLVAMKLWKIYVDNVETCSGLKLLHLPTDEVKVYSTIDKPSKASFENLALCLAIYFASTASLDDLEVQKILAQDKETHLLNFKFGLEQSFAQGDFLDRPTLTGLHAFAIYISALRVHNRGKGIWILNGLAIRIAQFLGLHRDGARLGLSPFQSEIRRRLWWHLITREFRSGEDYGIESTIGLSHIYDVSLPLNVDDADLYPEMERLPAPRRGWTPMTFSLVSIDISKASQKLAAKARSSSPSSPPSEDMRAHIINETQVQVEERLRCCNPIIPEHRMAGLCARFVLRKLDFITRQQWAILRQPHSDEAFVTEKNLIDALDILDPGLFGNDEMLGQYAWCRKAYPQYHMMMYILWHLSVKPEGPNIDKAWNVVETVINEVFEDDPNQKVGSKVAVLMALKARALSVRETIRGSKVGKHNRSDSIRPSHQVEDFSPEEMHSGTLLGEFGGSGLGVDIGEEGWPDWSTIVQTLQPDSLIAPDFLW